MREEIRRRALHAAAAVSLTLGLAGCASEVSTSSTTAGQGGAGVGGRDGTGSTESMGGAGGAQGTGGGIADAGADAETNCHQAADYAACCAANNWDYDAGCLAWGPPMPPAMEVA